MVKQMMAKLPARTDRRFAELEPAEMLDALTPKALCKIAEILDLPTDLDSLGGDKMMQHRRYRMQAEVAQSITATRIRVDAEYVEIGPSARRSLRGPAVHESARAVDNPLPAFR